MSAETVEIRKKSLTKRLRIARKQVEALEEELTLEMDAGDKVLLQERIKELYASVEATEEELNQLDTPPSPEKSSLAASQGLRSLVEILKDSPEARVAVIRFGADFQAANERIDLLGDYKDLHDLLHRLQFQCYNRIVQEARRFPDDELGLENLMDHELTLQNITRNLKRSVKVASIKQHDSSYDTSWIQSLVDAQQALNQAIESKEKKSLKRAIWLLNRVLAIHPAQINARLMETVHTLRLPTLVSAMSSVHDILADFDLDEYELVQFELGVGALADLNGSLTALVNEHNSWQQVDLELRRIETLLEHDTLDLKMSWPYLRADAENLMGDGTNRWAEMLKEDIGNLDVAIENDDSILLKRHFKRYRWRVANRFYEVDVDLKAICGNLRDVGVPLASMMRVLE